MRSGARPGSANKEDRDARGAGPIRMKRLTPLLALLVADAACAAVGAGCFPGAPWCEGGELGLAWVPIVVGLQLAHLYYLLGGPGPFLARVIGDDGNLREGNWGLLQVGVPIAVVLAFPPLIGLTVLGKFHGPIGLLEIVIVQGAYWLWLRHRLARHGAPAPATEAETSPTESPDPLPMESPAALERAERGRGGPMLESIGLPSVRFHAQEVLGTPPMAKQPIIAPLLTMPMPAPPKSPVRSVAAVSSLPQAQNVYAGAASAFRPRDEQGKSEAAPAHADIRSLIDRLTKLYMWDDIGTAEPFRGARRLPVERLTSGADGDRFGEELLTAMRHVARHTVMLYRCGVGDESLADIVEAHPVEGFDEYSADVMQRIVCSVLLDRHKLFLDQTDLEIFGEDFVDCLYRLALFEVKGTIACHPGVSQTAMNLSLQ